MTQAETASVASTPAAANGAVHADKPGLEPPSILILTKDEEVNIGPCLDCFGFSDDVVVLDSYSTDRTLEICKRYPNVRIVQRKFDTWSKHSNWALENIKFKHPWVYYSDADERVPEALRDEILTVINDPTRQEPAYRLKYRNMFMGRWLRRGGVYPVWIIRLFRPERIRYEDREVNAHPVVDGPLGVLQNDFIHYSFNKGLVPWLRKHNSYSQMEAHEAVRVISGSLLAHLRLAATAKGVAKRRAIKNLSFYLPMRAFARFAYMYFLRLGMLDGSAGFQYAAMISMYEYWMGLKIAELRRPWKERSEQLVTHVLNGGARRWRRAYTPPPGPRPDPSTSEVDILIPTFNEASHIRETVENARTVGNVFVLDSCSTDGTQQIARDAGAVVVEHPFENYSRQKNWGLDNLPFTGKWVFILDADERITPALRDEIFRTARDPNAAAGYFVNRVVVFMGREIRHGGLYPSWNLRFFKRGLCRYEDRAVHEHMICNGRTDYLKHEMLHIRRETISEYISKHIRYADMESDEWIKAKTGKGGAARGQALFPSYLHGFRQWLRREAWPRAPMRPALRFAYMYLFKLGILDGRAGLHLAYLMASYEYMISLMYRDKLRAIRHAGEPEPHHAKSGRAGA